MATAEFRKERSAGGFKITPLKSGLQKYIRRGMVDKARACLAELLTIATAPGGSNADRKRVMTNLRHRLQIIYLEDVCDISLWPAVDRLLRKQNFTPETAHAATALLARATKCRVCSHARAVGTLPFADARHQGLADDFPDIKQLLDEFRATGGAEEVVWRNRLSQSLADRRPIAVLWATAISLRGEKRRVGRRTMPVWQIFAELARAGVQHNKLAAAWYIDLQSTRESFLAWKLPLLAHVDRHVVNEENQRYVSAPVGADPPPLERLDSFVFDGIHARGQGRDSDAKYTRFALEGAHVENENEEILRPSWKEMYLRRKMLADQPDAQAVRLPVIRPSPPALRPSPTPQLPAHRPAQRLPPVHRPAQPAMRRARAAPAPMETKRILFDVRAQLTSSDRKTDVYFGRDHATGKYVVVKGPLSKVKNAELAVHVNDWKRAAGLPTHTSISVVMMVPDRWPEGVPLGSRNRVDRTRPAPFLITESAFPEMVPRCNRYSAKWPNTMVARIDDPLKILAGWPRMTEQERSDYVFGLLGRYVTGVGDPADRNFVRRDGRLLSLDEDSQPRQVGPLRRGLRRQKSELVTEWLQANRDMVVGCLDAWPAPGSQIPGGAARLAELRDWDSLLRLFAE